MTASVIAAQLYTLRQFTRTPADIAATLKKVKQIGYDAVQCSAMGPIEPKELAKILQGEGLTCCATHVGWDKFRDNLDALIEEHRIIGCKYPAIGGMFMKEYPHTAEGFERFAHDASPVGRKLKNAGMLFGYHNHAFELERFGNKTALDILIEKTDPSITFEIDTYWIQAGGGDPAAWIRKVAGRIPLVHLKDMTYGADKSELDQKKSLMAEVGEGNLNWPAILSACKDAGVVWYIIEQDVCQRDPFESLAISLRNLKAMGLK